MRLKVLTSETPREVQYRGTGPFMTLSGDFNKTPWAVDPNYNGRLVVRGQQINGPGAVTFGFWPLGFGTPADRRGCP